MSGGAFDYSQHKVRKIYEIIQEELDNQGKDLLNDKTKWYNKEYYEKYPEERFAVIYSEKVQEIFKEGIEALKKAEVYTQRIDWYLSGDDGEESLIERLKEELEAL